jgi:hypothetical protein
MIPTITDVTDDVSSELVVHWLSETIGSYSVDAWKLLQFHSALSYGEDSSLLVANSQIVFGKALQ